MRLSALALIFALSACATSGGDNNDQFPQTKDERDRARIGTLTGSSGLKLFGGSSKSSVGITVNTYLWNGSLDAVSFMPLASADPFGGTIITDWYHIPNDDNHQYKVNIIIRGSHLKSDAIRVSAFKREKKPDGTWKDSGLSPEMSKKIEEKILYRAREIRFNHIK